MRNVSLPILFAFQLSLNFTALADEVRNPSVQPKDQRTKSTTQQNKSDDQATSNALKIVTEAPKLIRIGTKNDRTKEASTSNSSRKFIPEQTPNDTETRQQSGSTTQKRRYGSGTEK